MKPLQVIKPMKKIITTSTLLILFALSIVAATPQQTVSPEKKSAMHNLDPVDIFPQARERSGKENKRGPSSAKISPHSAQAELATNSSEPESSKRSLRSSRRHHSSEDTAHTDRVALATPTPAIDNPSAQPEPDASASTIATPALSLPLAETSGKNREAPPQTLASISNLPEGEGGVRNHLLSLPVIVALLVIVLISLVLVFAKLVRFLRGPAV